MVKIGIVLSGGGMRGMAHLGALKALKDFGIVPGLISGASAGAIFGACYSFGFTPEEVLHLMKKENLFNLSGLLFRKTGLFNTTAFENTLIKHLPANTFESLPVPMYIAATDIVNCKTVYFSSGNLSKAITASSCVPVVFQPVQIDDTLLVDGGVLNNLPVEPLIGQCDKIIGIHVNSLSTKKEHFRMTDILERSAHLALSGAVYENAAKCDLFIEPNDMSQFGMFQFERAEEIFDYAYQYTKSQQEKILAFAKSAKLFDEDVGAPA